MKTLVEQSDEEKDRYPLVTSHTSLPCVHTPISFPLSLYVDAHICRLLPESVAHKLFLRFLTPSLTPLLTLRAELSKAVAMIGDYEQTREEKETEIRRLQVEPPAMWTSCR